MTRSTTTPSRSMPPTAQWRFGSGPARGPHATSPKVSCRPRCSHGSAATPRPHPGNSYAAACGCERAEASSSTIGPTISPPGRRSKKSERRTLSGRNAGARPINITGRITALLTVPPTRPVPFLLRRKEGVRARPLRGEPPAPQTASFRLPISAQPTVANAQSTAPAADQTN